MWVGELGLAPDLHPTGERGAAPVSALVTGTCCIGDTWELGISTLTDSFPLTLTYLSYSKSNIEAHSHCNNTSSCVRAPQAQVTELCFRGEKVFWVRASEIFCS